MGLKKRQKNQKPVKLRTIFISYLSVFCVGTILLALIFLLTFGALLSAGVILPANYAEKQLSAAKETIVTSKTITPELIPDLCRYAVYAPNGKLISGNLSSGEAQKAWNLIYTNDSSQDNRYFYLKIPRRDDVCIVRYTILAQFSSPVLRRFLPNPELLACFLCALGFFLEVFFLASSFGKNISRKISGLQNATEKIQNQDLDFSIKSSGVWEIDNVLYSIDEMKVALQASLRKQWELEQMRREQITALAHDIKTPLTIVRGNVELLAETNLTEEQKEYTGYIAESADQMAQYIKTLIEISKAEMGNVFSKGKIDSKKYMAEIHSRVDAITAARKINVDFSVRNLPQFFYADADLLQRAIMNVLANAVEYSPEHGEIKVSAEATGDSIRFCVTDGGKGFSPEALKQATEQFYMGDSSRTSKTHYGMGLFITESIVRLHKGKLRIDNSPTTGGGQVAIEIPIN